MNQHNSREKQRNAKCIVRMQDATTILLNPNFPSEEPKKFSFDFSYWSHDGFIEHPDSGTSTEADVTHANGFKYATQVQSS